MKQYDITITGSGTQNQIAIRLLDLGRMLQLADDDKEFEDKTFEDGCLIAEIKS